LARTCGEQLSVSSTSQTETAPQSSGAAVTVTNLARRPALSSRRASSTRRNDATRSFASRAAIPTCPGRARG